MSAQRKITNHAYVPDRDGRCGLQYGTGADRERCGHTADEHATAEDPAGPDPKAQLDWLAKRLHDADGLDHSGWPLYYERAAALIAAAPDLAAALEGAERERDALREALRQVVAIGEHPACTRPTTRPCTTCAAVQAAAAALGLSVREDTSRPLCCNEECELVPAVAFVDLTADGCECAGDACGWHAYCADCTEILRGSLPVAMLAREDTSSGGPS